MLAGKRWGAICDVAAAFDYASLLPLALVRDAHADAEKIADVPSPLLTAG